MLLVDAVTGTHVDNADSQNSGGVQEHQRLT